MFYQALWVVPDIQSSKLCEETHVSTFQVKSTIHEHTKLIKIAYVLVVVTNLFQIINLDNGIETTYLNQSKFFCIKQAK